jgi:hypothetical protein
MRTTFGSRVKRIASRAAEIWAELEYAQERLFDLPK